jgi:hypothetical protein
MSADRYYSSLTDINCMFEDIDPLGNDAFFSYVPSSLDDIDLESVDFYLERVNEARHEACRVREEWAARQEAQFKLDGYVRPTDKVGNWQKCDDFQESHFSLLDQNNLVFHFQRYFDVVDNIPTENISKHMFFYLCKQMSEFQPSSVDSPFMRSMSMERFLYLWYGESDHYTIQFFSEGIVLTSYNAQYSESYDGEFFEYFLMTLSPEEVLSPEEDSYDESSDFSDCEDDTQLDVIGEFTGGDVLIKYLRDSFAIDISNYKDIVPNTLSSKGWTDDLKYAFSKYEALGDQFMYIYFLYKYSTSFTKDVSLVGGLRSAYNCNRNFALNFMNLGFACCFPPGASVKDLSNMFEFVVGVVFEAVGLDTQRMIKLIDQWDVELYSYSPKGPGMLLADLAVATSNLYQARMYSDSGGLCFVDSTHIVVQVWQDFFKPVMSLRSSGPTYSSLRYKTQSFSVSSDFHGVEVFDRVILDTYSSFSGTAWQKDIDTLKDLFARFQARHLAQEKRDELLAAMSLLQVRDDINLTKFITNFQDIIEDFHTRSGSKKLGEDHKASPLPISRDFSASVRGGDDTFVRDMVQSRSDSVFNNDSEHVRRILGITEDCYDSSHGCHASVVTIDPGAMMWYNTYAQTNETVISFQDGIQVDVTKEPFKFFAYHLIRGSDGRVVLSYVYGSSRKKDARWAACSHLLSRISTY